MNVPRQDLVVLTDIVHGDFKPLMHGVFIDTLKLTVWIEKIIAPRVVAIKIFELVLRGRVADPQIRPSSRRASTVVIRDLTADS